MADRLWPWMIDERRKIVYVQELLDATRFLGVWEGQAYECRGLPDTGDLAVGDSAVCHVIPGSTELVYVSTVTVPIVIIWHGNTADIPTGWQLADGSGGSPDLRERFIRASNGALGPVDEVAGANTVDRRHRHSSAFVTLNPESAHTHTWPAGDTGPYGGASGGGGPATNTYDINHTHSFAGGTTGAPSGGHNHAATGYTDYDGTTTTADENRPPYHCLPYIYGKVPPAAVPDWGIVLFRGLEADVPDGFVLCDGAAGAPNLMDIFVRGLGVGPGEFYGVGGGAETIDPIFIAALSHVHTKGTIAMSATDGEHQHTASGTTNVHLPPSYLQVGFTLDAALSAHNHPWSLATAQSGAHAHTLNNNVHSDGFLKTEGISTVPAYWRLAYIQKRP